MNSLTSNENFLMIKIWNRYQEYVNSSLMFGTLELQWFHVFFNKAILPKFVDVNPNR